MIHHTIGDLITLLVFCAVNIWQAITVMAAPEIRIGLFKNEIPGIYQK